MKKIKTKYTLLNQISFFVLVLSSALVPLSFWTGFDNKFDLIKVSVLYFTGGVFIILSCVYFIVEIHSCKFSWKLMKDKTLDLLILIFFASVIISSIFSSDFYISYNGTYDRQIGLLLFLYLIIIYFLSGAFLSDESRINKILSVMEIMALITSLYIITGYLGYNILNVTPESSLRPYSNVGHPVFSAGFIVMIFPLSLLNITHKKNIIIRMVFPFLMFLGVVFTLTRTAYISITVEILLIIILVPVIYRKNGFNLKKYILYSLPSAVFVVFCILAFIYLFPENGFVKRLLSISNLTSQPRWYLWRDSIKMFLDHPFAGTGPGLFSNVFENYASYQLKYAEIKGFFDHAHNNFIDFFCTTGITGGLSYLLILVYVIIASGKIIFSKKTESNVKLFFMFLMCSFSGYFIFGLADFDDISILLYLFILLSVFKSKYSNINSQIYSVSNLQIVRKAGYIFFILLITLSVYNLYSTVNKILAQNNYITGVNNYNSGKFNESVYYYNKAITLQPEQPHYRFEWGYSLLTYCFNHSELTAEMEGKWLKTAKEEFYKANNNYPYPVYCLSYISLIELEEGNEKESDKIKSEIFKIDTFQFAYRANLASYYLKHNRDCEAISEIDFVLKYDINNTDVLFSKVYYLKRVERYAEAMEVCRKLLELNPNHKQGKAMIAWLKTKTNS